MRANYGERWNFTGAGGRKLLIVKAFLGEACCRVSASASWGRGPKIWPGLWGAVGGTFYDSTNRAVAEQAALSGGRISLLEK